MKRTIYRMRHRKVPSKSEGTFFKKESQETFFGGSEHDSFFKSGVTHGPGESVQRKCEKCEEEEKQVQRAPEKKEEEKKVMKKENKKEEEKIQRAPEKKEEEKKVMRVEEKKDDEKKVMKKEEKKEEEKIQRAPEKKEEEKKVMRVEEKKDDEKKVMKKEDKKEEEKIQKKEATTTTRQGTGGNVSNYISSRNGKGEALPAPTNQFFSSRMGYDFSQVRVHKDKEASESARAVNAKAYTVGNNIVFNEGQYNMTSGEGKKLMAHELTHVMQNAPEESLSRKKSIAQQKNIEVDTPVNASMPAVVDAIFAVSDTLKPYIDVKSNLIAEKGKFKINIGYENLKIAYKDCFGDESTFDGTIGGFFCRKTGVIHTVAGNKKEPTSAFGDVVHEAIHKKSSRLMAGLFTDFINEGVTQYFADKVLVEQGLGEYKGHKYGPELKCAQDLIRVAGPDEVAQYYFHGKGPLIDVLNKKFATELKRDKFSQFVDYIRQKSVAHFCAMLKNK